MEANFKCQCGATERDKPPFRCETCPDCGSQILLENEIYDEPLPHVPVERVDEFGRAYTICKRCGKIM